MIALLAGWALGAPVLEDVAPPDVDPLERCAAAAAGEAGELPQADVLAGDRVAVVVGVPCHRSAAIPSLRYATRDAVRMTAVLRGAGFAVRPLLGVVDRVTLLEALDAAVRAVPAGGTLVVYFSGHGVLRTDGDELRRYLVLSDTELTAVGTTGLPVRELEARLSEVPGASRVLIQDTCFAHRSGGKAVTVTADAHEQAKGLSALEPPVRPGRGELRLYASRLLEQATESATLRGSVYTAHLIDALADPASDLDGDGCTGWLEAHARARARTVADRGGLQVPVAAASEGAVGLALGCRPGPAARAVIDTTGDDRLRVALVGPDGQPAPVPGAVPPGRYGLTVARWTTSRGGGGVEQVSEPIYDGPIRLRAGQWLDVEEVLAEHGPVLDLRALAAWAPARTLPRGLVGAEVGIAGRDRGRGRPLIGAAVRVGVGPGPDRVAKRTVDLVAQAGWAVAVRPGIAVGPGLGGGLVHRSLPDRTSPGAAPAGVGALIEPSVSLWAARGPVSARVALGARLIPVERGGRVRLDAAPLVLVGVGPRF